MEMITKRIINDDISNSAVYVKVVWLDNDTDLFHIKLLTPEISWSGRYSQDSATEDSERLDEDNYKVCVKEALTSAAAPAGYKFFLTSNSNDTGMDKTFTWKKICNQKLLQHGSIPIHADSPPVTYTDFIDQLINNNNHLQGVAGMYSDKIKILNDELDKVRGEMNKFISMKTTLETSLYGKFVELLNTKKRRIQELEKHVGDISNIDNEEMQ